MDLEGVGGPICLAYLPQIQSDLSRRLPMRRSPVHSSNPRVSPIRRNRALIYTTSGCDIRPTPSTGSIVSFLLVSAMAWIERNTIPE